MTTKNDALLLDRRTLVAYVLKEFEGKGGKVILPIGMSNLEEQAWLLDKVDVDVLLAAVTAGPRALDLISCQKMATETKKGHSHKPSNLTNTFEFDDGPPPSTPNPFVDGSPGPASRITGSEFGEPNPYGDIATGSAQASEPFIDMPQLNTGLKDEDLKYLAYTMFVACGANADDDMATTVESQLEIDRVRANQIAKTLKHVQQPTADPSSALSKDRLATLELQVKLLQKVRPKEFTRFKDFARWRDSTVDVVVQSLVRATHDEWIADSTQPAVTAQSLTARLKGAKRRVKVDASDDYDEVEYTEAIESLATTAAAIVKRVRCGWRFPWGLRAHLCELLLRGVFDTIEEGAYIDSYDEYVKLLQGVVWPVLGIHPAMHRACYAWVHFRQYAIVRQPSLAGYVTRQIKELATPSSNGVGGADGVFNQQLATAVSNHIITWLLEQLCDYRGTFAKATDMQVLLDMLSFAVKSQGKSNDDLAEMLVGVVGSSMDAEVDRQQKATRMDTDLSKEAGVEWLAGIVRWILQDEKQRYSVVLGRHLPEAHGVAAYRLHYIMAQKVLPWISKVQVLSKEVLQTIRTVRDVEKQLTEPVEAALLNCESKSVQAALGMFKPWDTAAQLQVVLANWVQAQLQGFGVWVTRQLNDEKWEPVGMTQAHSTSSQEVLRFVSDSIDTLFDMDIPLPPAIIAMHMKGSYDILGRYADHVREKLGPLHRLIPKVPALTRYKQAVAVAQEAAENSTPVRSGFANLLKNPFGSKKADPHFQGFLESIPKVEASPDWAAISQLTLRRVSVMVCSLQHLLNQAEPLAKRVRQRQEQKHAAGTDKMVDGALEAAQEQLSEAVDYAIQFLATKAIFWDQRRDWLEMLYRHQPSAHRIDPLLDAMLGTLEEVTRLLPDALRDVFAEALLNAACQAYERVLLDGGPTRLYTVSDLALLEQDLFRLKALFAAEGEGLKRTIIDAAVARLAPGLSAMHLDNASLVAELKAAQRGDKEREVLLVRVAAHRADRTVSKHLKEAYNLPKRLKA